MRVGTVSSVRESDRTARVHFAAVREISGNLKVLKASGDDWLPEIGDSVLCLFLPNGEGDGVILGVI
jgi:phage baseplate assembly protein gpV